MGNIIETQTERMCKVFLSTELSDGEKYEAARLLLQETSVLGSLEQDKYGADPFASTDYDVANLARELDDTVARLEPILIKAGIVSRDAAQRSLLESYRSARDRVRASLISEGQWEGPV